MNVVFVCGGSAGHVNPAIAIAEELRNKHPMSKIIFIGADKALEKRLVPEAGFELINIKMTGLRRGFSPSDIIYNIKTAINLVSAERKSSRLLRDFKPDAVIGTGGYISYPVLKKASKKRIATFLLEPNAYPGLAVKMLSASVDKIFIAYKGAENELKHPEKAVFTGTPLLRRFFENDTGEAEKPEDKKLVVSFWGSLGAARMNDMMAEFIKLNVESECFNHIHATGAIGSIDKLKASLSESGVKNATAPIADIREYIDDMPSIMKKADLVMCRAGASTIAELTAMGKPAILIPSPNVAENHQELNAKQLCSAGGAVMVSEKECDGKVLFDLVRDLLNDGEKLEKMSAFQKSLSVSDSSSVIIDFIYKFVQERRVQ